MHRRIEWTSRKDSDRVQSVLAVVNVTRTTAARCRRRVPVVGRAAAPSSIQTTSSFRRSPSSSRHPSGCTRKPKVARASGRIAERRRRRPVFDLVFDPAAAKIKVPPTRSFSRRCNRTRRRPGGVIRLLDPEGRSPRGRYARRQKNRN